jgi:hypothetical protein
LQDGLRLLLLIPEFRLRYLFLELPDFRAFAVRIKDNPVSGGFFLRWQ